MSESLLDKLTQVCTGCAGEGGEDCDDHMCSTQWHKCGRCNGTKLELKPKYATLAKWLEIYFGKR